MKEVEHKGFTQVIFETNSKNVVDAIHNLRVGNSEFSSIICNIKNILWQSLLNVKQTWLLIP
jgi:ribonuclease HI